MTPPTSSGFGTTMRTSRKSYSRKTLTHVSPGSMISSSTSDSDNSLHSLYFTSYHGLINYPQKIPAEEVQRVIALARQWAERLAKPVGVWMSDKQDAFVQAIGTEFPHTPHRYCQNHFLRD